MQMGTVFYVHIEERTRIICLLKVLVQDITDRCTPSDSPLVATHMHLGQRMALSASGRLTMPRRQRMAKLLQRLP